MWIFRALLFSLLVLIDLTTVPYALGLKEVITDQVYVTNFYGVPRLAGEDVRTCENDLLRHYRRRYPNDNITSYSFLGGYIYCDDSRTEGYTTKELPIYVIYIYRTYEAFTADAGRVLVLAVTFDDLIALMIAFPPYGWKRIFRSYEEIPPD